jgi:RimJ/RimL family protein N-acetyltransferase
VPLDNSDKEEATAFLLRSPENNVVPLFNITHFGMDPGDTPFHGYYFGNREGSGLTAVGVVFNLGSMFFHAVGEDAVSGMADHIISAGKSPFFTEGPRSQIQRLLSELRGKYDSPPKTLRCERLLLRGGANPDIDTSGVRPSRLEDIETLVEMGRAMHREMFGVEGMDDHSFHELLRLQIETGGAYVRELNGRITAKAEATAVPPHAALIGGVYTAPAARGQGNATACVAALCEHILGEVETVALTAEPGNPAAYRMYIRVGFTSSAEWMTASFK